MERCHLPSQNGERSPQIVRKKQTSHKYHFCWRTTDVVSLQWQLPWILKTSSDVHKGQIPFTGVRKRIDSRVRGSTMLRKLDKSSLIHERVMLESWRGVDSESVAAQSHPQKKPINFWTQIGSIKFRGSHFQSETNPERSTEKSWVGSELWVSIIIYPFSQKQPV